MSVFFKMNFWCFGYAEVLSQLHRAETVDDFWESVEKDFLFYFYLYLWLVFVVGILPKSASKLNFSSK